MDFCAQNKLQTAIDETNRLVFRCSWQVHVPNDGDADAAAAVRRWAGTVGDAFRMPNGNMTSFEPASDIVVNSVLIEPGPDARTFSVAYSGIEKRASSDQSTPLIGVSETVSRNGERTKSARFRFHSETFAAFVPAVGAPLDWAGEAFVCEHCELLELASGEYELAVAAREVETIRLGNVVYALNSAEEKTASLTFFVGNTAYSEFTAGLSVGGAAEWAGEHYYLTGWSESAYGRIGRQIVCTAGNVETRLLQCVRSESFAGFDRGNAVRREIVYRSRWRVHTDDLESFRNLTGKPADWIDDDTIITTVSQTRLTPVESRLEIEAKQADSPSLAESSDFSDDRSNLSGRVDVDCRLTEFVMNATQCGFVPGVDGGFEPLSGFDAAKDCPLTERTAELDEHCIDLPLATVQITETKYLRGSVNHNLRELVEFGAAPVFSGNVAGHPGSYRRIDVQASELRDRFHLLFTRITRVYQLAPTGFAWNAAFWNEPER